MMVQTGPCPVDVGDDEFQTPAVGSPGLLTQSLLELLQALLSRPAMLAGERIPQKLECLFVDVDQAGFLRVQRQAVLDRPVLHQSQRGLSLLRHAAQDHRRHSQTDQVWLLPDVDQGLTFPPCGVTQEPDLCR